MPLEDWQLEGTRFTAFFGPAPSREREVRQIFEQLSGHPPAQAQQAGQTVAVAGPFADGWLQIGTDSTRIDVLTGPAPGSENLAGPAFPSMGGLGMAAFDGIVDRVARATSLFETPSLRIALGVVATQTVATHAAGLQRVKHYLPFLKDAFSDETASDLLYQINVKVPGSGDAVSHNCLRKWSVAQLERLMLQSTGELVVRKTAPAFAVRLELDFSSPGVEPVAPDAARGLAQRMIEDMIPLCERGEAHDSR